MSAYEQDLKEFSDQELSALLSVVYEQGETNADGESCLPIEVEARARELCEEIERRRWEALTPEEQERETDFRKRFVELALIILQENLVMRSSLEGIAKIGDTINVRRPIRYLG